jgi:hypothetical protein
MADRLAAASAVIWRVESAASDGGCDIVNLLTQTESEGLSALAAETRARGNASGGRRALVLYLLQDRRGGRLRLLFRLLSVVTFSTGWTALRTWAVPSRASWRQVRRVAFQPDSPGAELLTRYLVSKLEARRHLAGEATLVSGFNLIVAAYGLVNVLARMRAAAKGRSVCVLVDLQLAVGGADLLVVEHPGLYQDRFQRLLVQAALGSSTFCGDLLRFLER